jgi:glycosyltransferase involved in cell wall biosynthesis
VYRRATELGVSLVAISRHQASTALDVPIAAVIHHGIDTSRYPVGEGDGAYAAFVGRMSPDKGLHTAIRVAREAGMPLKVAAKMHDRSEHDYFEHVIRPLLGGDIEYLGEVGGDRKLDLLGRAACLLNPVAWAEPFGMVMIEALACGTPVVATPVGAASEIVDDGETGFLRSDEESLRTALGHVGGLDRHACRRAAEERFSSRRMAADHLALYARVIAEAGDRPALRGVQAQQ